MCHHQILKLEDVIYLLLLHPKWSTITYYKRAKLLNNTYLPPCLLGVFQVKNINTYAHPKHI